MLATKGHQVLIEQSLALKLKSLSIQSGEFELITKL